MSLDHASLYSQPNLERNLSSEQLGLYAERKPAGRDIEITDVQTTMVSGNYLWTLVRVYTDAGIVGTGESFIGGGVPEIIQTMKPFLIGENPLDIDRLYEHLIQCTSGWGSVGGAVIAAISGIDIALNDIAGKVHEAPAYQFLGGKYRDSVRVYCDCHAGEHIHHTDRTSIDDYEVGAYVDAAASAVADGYDVVKFDLDIPSAYELDPINRHLTNLQIDEKAKIVEALTKTTRGEAYVAFDGHWTWTAESAIRLANTVEGAGPLWLEDLVPPENLEVQARVTHNTDVPIATGENLFRRHGFRQLIEEQAIDILQPDLVKVGGMRETYKLAMMADVYSIPIALHNICSPVGTMANVHVATAVPNFLALEFHARDVAWWDDMVEEDVIEDGCIQIPEKPGIGITLDMDTVEEHMVEGETLFDEA